MRGKSLRSPKTCSRQGLTGVGAALLLACSSAGAPSEPNDSPLGSGGQDVSGSGGSSTGAGGFAASGGGGATGGSLGSGGTRDSGGNFGSGGGLGSGGILGSGGDFGSGGQLGSGGVDSAGGATGTGGSMGVFPPGVTTVKIMIVGDSISAGPGCYKKYLVQELENQGHSLFQFVGQYNDDCGGNVQHSAVSCSTSQNFTQPSFTVPSCFGSTQFDGMSALVATHDPDLILIQLGVNDVWGGSGSIQPILDNYTTLVNQARAHNPNVVVVVAQIHRIITDNCTNSNSTTKAEELVGAVPSWAAGVTTNDSPIFVADLWTNSDPTEADDCVHPNDAGARRMAGNWYEALKDIVP